MKIKKNWNINFVEPYSQSNLPEEQAAELFDNFGKSVSSLPSRLPKVTSSWLKIQHTKLMHFMEYFMCWVWL